MGGGGGGLSSKALPIDQLCSSSNLSEILVFSMGRGRGGRGEGGGRRARDNMDRCLVGY